MVSCFPVVYLIEKFEWMKYLQGSLISLAISTFSIPALKNKSGVDKIIFKKQPYQLLNTNRGFFPSFDASSFHKMADQFS